MSYNTLFRLLAIIALIFLFLIIGSGGIVVFPFILLVHNSQTGYSLTAQQLFLNVILILTTLKIAQLSWQDIGFKATTLKLFIKWTVIGSSAAILYIILAWLLGEPIIINPYETIVKVITVVIPFAVAEEIIFRGILLTYLQ